MGDVSQFGNNRVNNSIWESKWKQSAEYRTKNAGAAGTATGVEHEDESSFLPRHDSTPESSSATLLTSFDKSCIAFLALRELPRDHARAIAEEALVSARIPGETPQMTAAIAQASREYRRSRDRRAL
ncbi:hypothetical protein [Aliiruegeria lutimaris]|uniref:Uncharacterized protein n=1 Tax=Aliiruegeria lutimaris TaxID=571298 RepID=A0A1G9MDR9_9RHOB|nr:hypothetical protein [Aliiruegeria lutimaris]SDL72406.1 hypothetical protein SAMN04488026_11095 [Aliiruegeria lutimaris]